LASDGFAYEVWNASIFELVRKGVLASAGVDGGGFLDAPLVFDPGERCEYGISVDWLGRLVEVPALLRVSIPWSSNGTRALSQGLA
jgi:methyl acetate hydrolase